VTATVLSDCQVVNAEIFAFRAHTDAPAGEFVNSSVILRSLAHSDGSALKSE
jgi:hypothetical protein